ncbi:hypothetical protein IHE44_0002105 [Lamprotornis superbus]|uniref:Golgi integral membrane protein 4 n=1 Tax=Lamprotornis superbus TaxID=245042 RepID=A0A835TX05_9PASS|nr:hypothetical protein IHE44_0002105 [Lamprotornis superbus]
MQDSCSDIFTASLAVKKEKFLLYISRMSTQQVEGRMHCRVQTLQVQVVYEHRSRLEKSLQKERLEHKKAKEDFLVYKLEAQETLNKGRQDSNSRYSALSVQHQMLKVGDWDSRAPGELVVPGTHAWLAAAITAECQGSQHEELKKQHADLEEDHRKQGEEFSRTFSDHKERYLQLQQEKEQEISKLKESLYNLREENRQLRKAHQDIHTQLQDVKQQHKDLLSQHNELVVTLEDHKSALAAAQVEEYKQLKDTLKKIPSFQDAEKVEGGNEQPEVQGPSPHSHTPEHHGAGAEQQQNEKPREREETNSQEQDRAEPFHVQGRAHEGAKELNIQQQQEAGEDEEQRAEQMEEERKKELEEEEMEQAGQPEHLEEEQDQVPEEHEWKKQEQKEEETNMLGDHLQSEAHYDNMDQDIVQGEEEQGIQEEEGAYEHDNQHQDEGEDDDQNNANEQQEAEHQAENQQADESVSQLKSQCNQLESVQRCEVVKDDRFQLVPVGMELALTAPAALLSREMQLDYELEVFNTHSCKLQKAAMEDVNPADDPNNQGEDEFEEAEQEREENLPDENEKHKETGQKQGHPGMEEHLVMAGNPDQQEDNVDEQYQEEGEEEVQEDLTEEKKRELEHNAEEPYGENEENADEKNNRGTDQEQEMQEDNNQKEIHEENYEEEEEEEEEEGRAVAAKTRRRGEITCSTTSFQQQASQTLWWPWRELQAGPGEGQGEKCWSCSTQSQPGMECEARGKHQPRSQTHCSVQLLSALGLARVCSSFLKNSSSSEGPGQRKRFTERQTPFELILFKDALSDSIELGLKCQSVFLIFTFPHSGAVELIPSNIMFLYVTPAKGRSPTASGEGEPAGILAGILDGFTVSKETLSPRNAVTSTDLSGEGILDWDTFRSQEDLEASSSELFTLPLLSTAVLALRDARAAAGTSQSPGCAPWEGQSSIQMCSLGRAGLHPDVPSGKGRAPSRNTVLRSPFHIFSWKAKELLKQLPEEPSGQKQGLPNKRDKNNSRMSWVMSDVGVLFGERVRAMEKYFNFSPSLLLLKNPDIPEEYQSKTEMEIRISPFIDQGGLDQGFQCGQGNLLPGKDNHHADLIPLIGQKVRQDEKASPFFKLSNPKECRISFKNPEPQPSTGDAGAVRDPQQLPGPGMVVMATLKDVQRRLPLKSTICSQLVQACLGPYNNREMWLLPQTSSCLQTHPIHCKNSLSSPFCFVHQYNLSFLFEDWPKIAPPASTTGAKAFSPPERCGFTIGKAHRMPLLTPKEMWMGNTPGHLHIVPLLPQELFPPCHQHCKKLQPMPAKFNALAAHCRVHIAEFVCLNIR